MVTDIPFCHVPKDCVPLFIEPAYKIALTLMLLDSWKYLNL